MKTKIVYVAVSNNKCIYLEQACVSAWSVRYFNPTAEIILIVDTETNDYIKEYKSVKIADLFDEIIVVGFAKKYSNFEKSRLLKTGLPKYIEGRFLFVDSDTVICGSLDDLDEVECTIGMVADCHYETLADHPMKQIIRDRTKRLFGVCADDKSTYYNSGVILSDGSLQSKEIFSTWNKLWQSVSTKPHGRFDQVSLYPITLQEQKRVQEISGVYNTQIVESVKYLASAKILHFFNYSPEAESIHPFFGDQFYQRVKTYGLTQAIQNDILNVKQLFNTPSKPVGKSAIKILNTPGITVIAKYIPHRLLRGISGLLKKMH